jgi:hypothetical protein
VHASSLCLFFLPTSLSSLSPLIYTHTHTHTHTYTHLLISLFLYTIFAHSLSITHTHTHTHTHMCVYTPCRYTALLYGHDADEKRDMTFIPLKGTLFDSAATQVPPFTHMHTHTYEHIHTQTRSKKALHVHTFFCNTHQLAKACAPTSMVARVTEYVAVF